MLKLCALAALVSMAAAASVRAEGSLPPECAAVLEALGRQGDFKDNVCRVNLPRRDLAVTIAGRAAPTPFGFGGWLALAPADSGGSVMMGDLVLLEGEVNPVMSALLDAWDSTRGRRSPGRWTMPWSPGTWRCSTPRSPMSSELSARTASTSSRSTIT